MYADFAPNFKWIMTIQVQKKQPTFFSPQKNPNNALFGTFSKAASQLPRKIANFNPLLRLKLAEGISWSTVLHTNGVVEMIPTKINNTHETSALSREDE